MINMTILGNLTRDPIFREVTLKNGEKAKVANLRVAVNNRQKTYYIDAACWRGLSDVCKYLVKGRKVLLQGVPSAQLGEGKDGKFYANLQMSVDRLEFADSRGAHISGTETAAVAGAAPAPQDPDPVAVAPAIPEEAEQMPIIFGPEDMPF